MADYDYPPAKRQRNEDWKKEPVDNHNTPPSRVIHIRGLADTVIEADIHEALGKFGAISYVIMLPKKKQALLEYEDLSSAESLVSYTQTNSIYVGGRQAHFNYSTSQKLQRPSGVEGEDGNCVLLFTVLNPKYPITVDVMHTICNPQGRVVRIVIFRKTGVQSMVEFDSVDSAKKAKAALNGADIYSGCCTLKIEFAKPTRLNVYKNDQDSWDYTSNGAYMPPPAVDQRAALLAEPTGGYGGGYGGRAAARGPPQGGDYGGYGGGAGYGQESHYGGPAPPPQGRYDMYGGAPGDYYSGPQGAPPGAGGEQPGCVLMVYGLNMDRMNCSRLFNLLCLYGNILRIKFLKSKDGAAMVQMADHGGCERAIAHLNGFVVLGSKLQIAYSKQPFIQEVSQPYDLKDGAPSFKDFSASKNNRFTNPNTAAKNRIQAPGNVLYFFNAPPNMTEQSLQDIFFKCAAKPPEKIKVFPSKTERSSTGLLEWDDRNDCLEALILTNHVDVPHPNAKYPYVFKLCFSGSPIGGMGGEHEHGE